MNKKCKTETECLLSLIDQSVYLFYLFILLHSFGAEEDCLEVVAPVATKAANDPRLFPYPPKEEWWAMVMAKKPDTCGPPDS